MLKAAHSSPLLTPPLKWAGGKRWLIPQLMPLWQPYRNYRLVEPFVGGMAVALGLRPQRALLNDINPHLIHFYRCLQDGFTIRLPLHNDSEIYYQYRRQFNELVNQNHLHTQKSAALFYYMNRTGFNGLCRFNRKGEFNVPFGTYKTIHYLRDFRHYQETLQNWRFTHGDFANICVQVDDFIYADPPYDTPFTSYAREGFTWADQERLAHWLTQHPGPVVLSNQATERVIALYQQLGFNLTYIKAPRRISCNGDRTAVLEVLATRHL